jgi:hypothetical protein
MTPGNVLMVFRKKAFGYNEGEREFNGGKPLAGSSGKDSGCKNSSILLKFYH